MNTQWITTAETLPAHNERVLISREGVIAIASYDAELRAFILAEGETIDGSSEVLWMGMTRPHAFVI